MLSGLAGLYFMTRIYRIRARPFWDHWQVSTAFFGTAASLGGLLVALAWAANVAMEPALQNRLALIIACGLAVEAIGLVFHARAMEARGNEGAVSFHEQTTTFGYTYCLRNVLLGASLAGCLALAAISPSMPDAALIWGALAAAMLTAAVIGRTLFYVLVIPTTMPGAFFWRNKGFEEHARETGLARLPQVGVAMHGH